MKVSFSEKVNVLTGRNASGKTNILEAIFFLSTTKSHRTSVTKELINKDSKNFYIKGEAVKNGSSLILEIGCSLGGKKAIKLNHQKIRARRDIVGQMPVVFFSPEDLYMVKENPSFRRKFLDILISQIDHRYLLNLQKYQKIIIERNRALSQVRERVLDIKMLDVWDEQVIGAGMEIIRRRQDIVSKLNRICLVIHREMTGGNEEISLEYSPSAGTEDSYRKKLEEKKRQEIEQGITTTGPHRDDVYIFFNGMNLRQFGSQGQQRTVALSMKLGELELMKEEFNEYPIILFDDVMSELDDERREYFLEILSGKRGDNGPIQSFITTTGLKPFESIKNNINIIKVEKIAPCFNQRDTTEHAV